MASLQKHATLGACFQEARRYLSEIFDKDEFASPALDARLLVAAGAQCPDHAPLLNPELEISDDVWRAIEGFILRRGAGEPVARILGQKEFWGLTFSLSEETLVPRPETEGIIEEVLGWVDEKGVRQAPLRIVDLGTGSGAILIALLNELPGAVGIAVDLSSSALVTATQNAIELGVGERFHPICGDFGDALVGPFDIIVSNPPYIRREDRESLAREVKDHDPDLALYGGESGLVAYQRIFPWCAKNLTNEGYGIVEHGFDQYDAVARLAHQSGFQRTKCVFDMAKLSRFCCFGKKSGEF